MSMIIQTNYYKCFLSFIIMHSIFQKNCKETFEFTERVSWIVVMISQCSKKKMFDLDIFYSVYNITELDNTQSLPKPPEVQGHYTYTL